MNLDNIIQQRKDLTHSEKQQTKEIFKLFKEITHSLMEKDVIIVLNALDLCSEFFLKELEKIREND